MEPKLLRLQLRDSEQMQYCMKDHGDLRMGKAEEDIARWRKHDSEQARREERSRAKEPVAKQMVPGPGAQETSNEIDTC